jgi:RecA/RadA recombinase
MIPTGLQDLDRLLAGADVSVGDAEEKTGGMRRGVVTEIYGPPGVGKSTLG